MRPTLDNMLPMCPNSFQTVPTMPTSVHNCITLAPIQFQAILSLRRWTLCHIPTSQDLSWRSDRGSSTGGEGPTTWGDTLSYTPVTSLELSSMTEESPLGVWQVNSQNPTPRISLVAPTGAISGVEEPVTWAILPLKLLAPPGAKSP